MENKNNENRRRKALKRLSKYISYLLRHDPNGLNIDSEGWVNVDELLEHLNSNREEYNKVGLKDIEFIVDEGEKRRYSLKREYGAWFIRANYGHSIDSVNIKYKGTKPPKVLYHGTSPDALEAILKEGLQPMERKYVHLTRNTGTAYKTGRRHSHKKNPVILEINAERMYKDDIEFYKLEQGLWLTKEVLPKYIKVMEVMKVMENGN